MKPGAVTLGVIVSALLLAAAGVMYLFSGSSSEPQYRTAINLTRGIQQLSSNWSIEIARVRADPFADFDSLAAFIPRMARLKDNLSDTAQLIPDLPDRLAGDLNAYLSAVTAKEERVERFKTGYAVVRNSTRYLPLAAENVMQQAREAGDDDLVQAVSRLTQGMTSYLATPTDPVKERLAGDLQGLRKASVGYPLPLANALANLLSHAEVLLDKQRPTEELFQEATSSHISDLTDRLAGNLEFELGRKKALSAYYERGLLGVVGLLALFWIGLAWHQRARGGAAAVRAAPEAYPAEEPIPAPQPPIPAPDSSPFADQEGPEPEPAARAEAGALAPLAARSGIGSEVRSEAGPPADALGAGAGDEPLARAPASPAPDAPNGRTADLETESALVQGFLAERVAEHVAESTARIATGMDRLRQTQTRIRDLLQDSDALPEFYDGAGLDEEMETAGAVSMSVRREANAIADVARRLASFSHMPNGDADRGMINVNACVEEVIAATGAQDSATVATVLGNVPEVFASKTDIRLLLTKIIENSVHAVEGLDDRNGTIKIDTARKNDEILITIIDNGAGITPERRAKIFRPFYTSRDGALGLGLTLAGHLVRKYEGGIRINSLPGQGTVTRIILPAGSPAP